MPIHFNKVNAIRFAPFTTAERDAIPSAAREGLVIRNTDTSQLELCLSNVWYGILRLQAVGTITPTHHGSFVDGDLHTEYARTQAPEGITAAWQLKAGGSIRPIPGITPYGEVGLQVKVLSGAPIHSASWGVPCWVYPDNDLYINNNGSTGWTKMMNRTAAELITGLHNFKASGLGGLTDYDIAVGDVDTPSYGIMRIGNALIGRTSYNVASMDLDGAVILRNIGGPVTGQIEFALLESGGQAIRFALPKSGVGNATYNPRSMLIAGPAVLNDDIVTVGYWQGQGIFHNLLCDTSGVGADLGVQNDLEVERYIYADEIKESTPDAGVTVEGVLLKDGLVDGIDVAAHSHAAHGKVSKSIMFHSPSEDLAVEDWLSDQAVRVPASGKHGVWTPGTIYVRVGIAGTGTNTILLRTSTTLTGTRTTRATVNLGTNREASAAITWTPANGQYMWVAASAVGGTAPKNGVAQIDLEEAVY